MGKESSKKKHDESEEEVEESISETASASASESESASASESESASESKKEKESESESESESASESEEEVPELVQISKDYKPKAPTHPIPEGEGVEDCYGKYPDPDVKECQKCVEQKNCISVFQHNNREDGKKKGKKDKKFVAPKQKSESESGEETKVAKKDKKSASESASASASASASESAEVKSKKSSKKEDKKEKVEAGAISSSLKSVLKASGYKELDIKKKDLRPGYVALKVNGKRIVLFEKADSSSFRTIIYPEKKPSHLGLSADWEKKSDGYLWGGKSESLAKQLALFYKKAS